MKKVNNFKKWFTLIEILVAITVISILAVWAARINFNRLSDKQRSLILSNQVYSNIESIRNNSLLWKWVWTLLTTPKKTIINIKTSNSWSINTNHYSTTLSTSPFMSESWTTFWSFSSLSDLICYNSDLSESWSINNIDIIIKWSTLSLSWCTLSSSGTILDIQTKFKNFQETIRIDAISWIMEKI